MNDPAALSPLLRDDPVAAYWNGFIAADGCFSGWKNTRLQIALAAKDAAHLERLAGWMGHGWVRTESGGKVVRYAVADAMTVPQLQLKFDLRPRKTVNPPRHLPYCGVLLRAWFVGFIDGDGYIRKQSGRETAFLSTVSHHSWGPFLVELSSALNFGYVRYRTGGGYDNGTGTYVSLNSARHNEIADLKRFAEQLALPILARKWDRVDCSIIVIDRHERAERIRELIRAGERTSDIAREVGVTKSAVSQARARMRGVRR